MPVVLPDNMEWIELERPEKWWAAKFSFNKSTGKGHMLCVKCSCKTKTPAEMTSLERMAMIGLINIRPQFCDTCREVQSARWSDYMKKVWILRRAYWDAKDKRIAAWRERNKTQQDVTDNTGIIVDGN